eukprot:scaffold48881_cov63-Phaeocystis_antarctica.AAC.2
MEAAEAAAKALVVEAEAVVVGRVAGVGAVVVVVANVVEVQMAMAMVRGVEARAGEWAAPAVEALAEAWLRPGRSHDKSNSEAAQFYGPHSGACHFDVRSWSGKRQQQQDAVFLYGTSQARRSRRSRLVLLRIGCAPWRPRAPRAFGGISPSLNSTDNGNIDWSAAGTARTV